MEYTVLNNEGTKHHVTINQDSKPKENIFEVTIIRIRTNGGVPKAIVLLFDDTISFMEGLHQVNNIVELKEEFYNMIHNNYKEINLSPSPVHPLLWPAPRRVAGGQY